MYANRLVCRKCKTEYALELKYYCPKCGGIMEVCYNDEAMKGHKELLNDGSHLGMWKYSGLLPIKESRNIVSLGEGGTPLIRCQRLEKAYHADVKVYIKAEHLNPSGSFKDRPSSVGVSAAKEAGAEKVVIASSGNASAATASYCARAGMECVVFVPEATDPSKITQAAAYGARVIPVQGNYSNSYKMALFAAEEFGWPNITSTFLNPYTVEGDKTAAYEIFEQLGGKFPDVVIIPIASGPLMVGMYKGFQELKLLGAVSGETKLPAMVGVQSEQCMPVTKAYLEGKDQVCAWSAPIKTIAGGISDPLNGYEGDGTLTLLTAKHSGGSMTFLTEKEIWDATKLIEQEVGYYCEPTSATAVGAVKKLWENTFLKQDATVVCMLTGHGFKYSGRTCSIEKRVSSIEDLRQRFTQ